MTTKGRITDLPPGPVGEDDNHGRAAARDRQAKLLASHSEHSEHSAKVQRETNASRHRQDRLAAAEQRQLAAQDRQAARTGRELAVAALRQLPDDNEKVAAYLNYVLLADTADSLADKRDRQREQSDRQSETLDQEDDLRFGEHHDRRGRVHKRAASDRRAAQRDLEETSRQLTELERESQERAVSAARFLARVEYERDHDALTGLVGRRQIAPMIQRALDRRNQQLAEVSTVSVLVCDLDQFKSVNDTYGHAVGDQVLTITANRLAHSLREGVAARLGGDEFVLILETPDAASAKVIADRTIELMRRPLVTNVGALAVTMSVGMTTTTSHVQPSELIHRGDAALMAAKRAGGIDSWLLVEPTNVRGGCRLDGWSVFRRQR